jgi:bifunctional DNA-binding transcriptional regulator/antitoxin component of YhaV-PrlF toxin-antitoxin module
MSNKRGYLAQSKVTASSGNAPLRFPLPTARQCGSVESEAQRLQKWQEVMEGQEHRVYHTKLDASGRIVIPVEVRQRRKIPDGATLIVVDDDNGLRVQTIEDSIAEAQAYIRSFVPAGVSLVDELIAERRAEAERE